jgi:hypothetical protein
MDISPIGIWTAIKSLIAKIIALFKKAPAAVAAPAATTAPKTSWLNASADFTATWTGLKAVGHVVTTSYRQPSVLVIWGAIAIGGYLFGHHEEAQSQKAANAHNAASFGKSLASARAGTATAQAEVLRLTDELNKRSAPAVVAPAAAPVTKHKKAKAPVKAWWQS